MGNNLKAVDFGSYNGDARYVIDAACGAYHCCVILNDNEVVCWGPCNWQVCGQEATTAQSIGSSESHVGDNFQPIDFSAYPGRYPTEITCGYYHCCVFLDGTSELACWGSNLLGALGQGNGEHSTVPLLIQDLGTPAQACSEGGSGSSTGGSPQASVAVPKGTTMCYRYLDMETKMADLTELLKVFQTDGPESQEMTCVMKQMSRGWPHAPGAPEPNQKHRRPQVKFDVKNGEVTYVQSRRRTPRGGYKNQCYALGNNPSVQMSTGVDDPVSTAIRADSAWCNPCADIHSQQFSTMDGSDTVVVTTTTFVTWECKVWYGDDNKSKDSVTKCKTPRGIKCRKGSYTLYEGDEERNVNHGTLRCMNKNEYTDNKWSDQCEE
jgi:hypothetical protein